MSAQARTVALTDLPLLTLHDDRARHNNTALTLEHGVASATLGMRRALRGAVGPLAVVLGGSTPIWISRDGSTLLGLAALRPRSTHRVWEIDLLFHNGPDDDVVLLDLLDRAVATAGADGAHRIFLRLPEGSTALANAQRHGFSTVHEEQWYASEGVPVAAAPPPARPRRRADDTAFFRFYNQNTPHGVRWQMALTPWEWAAMQDPLGANGKEWSILDDAGAAIGLVRMAHSAHGCTAALLTDATPESTERAVRWAGSQSTRRAQPLHLVIPKYTAVQLRAAADARLAPSLRSILLVRPIAQRMRRLQFTHDALKAHAKERKARPVSQ